MKGKNIEIVNGLIKMASKAVGEQVERDHRRELWPLDHEGKKRAAGGEDQRKSEYVQVNNNNIMIMKN